MSEEITAALISTDPAHPTPREQLRLAAATLAAELDDEPCGCGDSAALEHRVTHVLHAADRIYAWITQPPPVARLTLTLGPVTDRAGPDHQGALLMANLQLGDTQNVTATVVADDAAGEPVPDQLTWTAEPAAAVSLTPSADTLSCVIGGLVPTAGVVITATDPAGNTVTGDVDVVGGPASALSLSFGPVSDKTPPAAPAA